MNSPPAAAKMSKLVNTCEPLIATLNVRCPTPVAAYSQKWSRTVYAAPGVRFGIVYVQLDFRPCWYTEAGAGLVTLLVLIAVGVFGVGGLTRGTNGDDRSGCDGEPEHAAAEMIGGGHARGPGQKIGVPTSSTIGIVGGSVRKNPALGAARGIPLRSVADAHFFEEAIML